jgi:hypothetical protein
MDYSDTFGNFIKGTDIPAGRDFELDITGVGVQEFNAMGAATDQNKQRKLVLGFKQTTKLLVCNATNARTIADAYGSNTDSLPGKKIIVSRVQTSMGPGVAVRVPASQPVQVAGDPFVAGSSLQPAKPDGDDFDTEIPF